MFIVSVDGPDEAKAVKLMLQGLKIGYYVTDKGMTFQAVHFGSGGQTLSVIKEIAKLSMLYPDSIDVFVNNEEFRQLEDNIYEAWYIDMSLPF